MSLSKPKQSKYLQPRKFRLHFNRINMQQGKAEVWTIHRSDLCIPARTVHVDVAMETVFRPTGSQPRAYFSGEGMVIDCGAGEYVICSVQMAFALMLDARDKGKAVRFV